ncbi:hypothetical protein LCL97_03900 [Seohaeicola saemankumensis]|nr:adenylate/guanylate cyclase domain-containing protein [Seohaeicola saemankumensis]MCA0869955.1 hypothetical protein [Seohaeicola saemankumensis]
MERRLSAILVADMVGYSRLMEQDEAETLLRQKVHRSDLIDPALATHHGRVVKTTGDGLLAEFPSIVEAVACAVEVQRAMAGREADQPQDRRIAYRIGIHLGDVFHEDGDIHGDGVNVAVRLEALAEPGGICLSGDAYNQLRGVEDIGFEDLRDVQVKNISRPIHVWRVLLDPEHAGKRTAVARQGHKARPLIAVAATFLLAFTIGGYWWSQRSDFTPADPDKYAFELPDKPSIAVLAFDNLSGDPDNDYIGDALSENIIATLATASRLFVIARNSSFHYKGTSTPVQTIAEDLGVRYVLEGSVQASGDKIRVTAQLIDALDGQHLWAKTYDRVLSTSELFAIQDSVTYDIVNTLEVELSSGDAGKKAWDELDDIQLVSLLNKSIEQYRLHTREGTLKSEELALELLEKKPDSAIALTQLGWSYWGKVAFGWSTDPAEDMKRAYDSANRALAANPEHAQALVFLAWIQAHSTQYDAALENANKALELSPGDGTLATLAGYVHSIAGQPQRGIELMMRGMRLEPYSPDWVAFSLASSLMMANRNAEARAILEAHIQKANPTITRWSHYLLAAIAVWEDDLSRARQLVETAEKMEPGYSLATVRRGGFSRMKDKLFLEKYVEALRVAGVPE